MNGTGDATVLLQARRVALGYGSAPVLREVDLEIGRGEFWFLLGPNGTGKTTLLRGILGEIPPQAGSIVLGAGLDSRRDIGFVPQRCDLNPAVSTTVSEFVTLGLTGLRVLRGEVAGRLRWALEHVGLSGFERRDYWSLSGGQRQRALVARALVRRPRFLILDEPTTGLDLPGRETLLRYLDVLCGQDELSVLLVTHDLASAAHHATHVALCAAGMVKAGPAAAVLTSEALERTYDMPITVLREPSGAIGIVIERTEAPS